MVTLTLSRVNLKQHYYLIFAEHVTLLEQQNRSYDYYVLTDYWHSNMYHFIVIAKINDSKPLLLAFRRKTKEKKR